jgi:hypothetical protein
MEERKIHLSNYAVSMIFPDALEVAYTYEDRDIYFFEEAAEKAYLLLERCKDIVVIDTGDYIIPPCDHFECETYDANYHIYLVSLAEWEEKKVDAFRVDSAWRQRANRCMKVPDDTSDSHT